MLRVFGVRAMWTKMDLLSFLWLHGGICCFSVYWRRSPIIKLQKDNLEHVVMRDHLSLCGELLLENVTYPPYRGLAVPRVSDGR